MKSKQRNNLIRNVRLGSCVAFTMYLLLLSYLTFFSHYYGRTTTYRDINLIPFKTIILFLNSSLSTEAILTNLLGNIVAFIPMGFLLPMVLPKVADLKKVALFIVLATLIIEAVQYTTAVGTGDIDDIILNFLGGLLGYGLYKWLLRFIQRWKSKNHSK